ncbi:uncharacterized protein N7484_006734 [Penicillium longicatenatum]|uniref:uncharacterized protein n=1 Tax=Penicillium longicatenatum TaxID=1561947 RepID=UPI00254769B2|nr:uncharacterized protein N7484_006734 [Penicillium longicatenatum]KAJ5644227.1 hypothetical protein N7484_006734 [Penicillium longicatenatum]
MTEHQENNIYDALTPIIHTFSPGILQLIRLISFMLGIDLLSYSVHVCLLLAMPALLTFIFPRTFAALKPCFEVFISSAEIKYRNNLYPQITKWMSTVEFHSLSSSRIVGTNDPFGYLWDIDIAPEFADIDDPVYHGKVIKVRYTPGQSCLHFFRFQNHWFALYRDPQDSRNDPFSRNSENIILYYFSWSKGALTDLMETIQKVNIDSQSGKVRIMNGYQSKADVQWRKMSEENGRMLESLALDKSMKQDIVSDMELFLSKDVIASYRRRGVPYRRSYLLHGAPGTGKTSLCRALAAKFGLSIYTINLATVDSYGLQELFRTLPSAPERCLVLLEDIDSAGIKRQVSTVDVGTMEPTSHQRGVTLGTVLNVLDGIGTKEGHLFVATTNVIAELDPALTRPGRMDRKFEFGNPDASTITEYFCHFFDDSKENVVKLATEFANEVPHRRVTPAALQEYFLQCSDDPFKAVANVSNLH